MSMALRCLESDQPQPIAFSIGHRRARRRRVARWFPRGGRSPSSTTQPQTRKSSVLGATGATRPVHCRALVLEPASQPRTPPYLNRATAPRSARCASE